MSRSIKHNPIITDYGRKRTASKTSKKTISDGTWYKKILCSYEIRDYKYRVLMK